MTSATARANRRIWRPTETDLGGRPGDPVGLRVFSPVETRARIAVGELTPALMEQVEMAAEFLPRARRGEAKCVQCERRFDGLPALIAWLQTPAERSGRCSGSARNARRPTSSSG